MFNNFTAFADPPEKEPQRSINVNSKTGISTDNPAREAHPYSEVYYNSPSLWEANPNTKDSKPVPGQPEAAGLSYGNRQHKLYYFNGRQNEPLVITNLLNDQSIPIKRSTSTSLRMKQFNKIRQQIQS